MSPRSTAGLLALALAAGASLALVASPAFADGSRRRSGSDTRKPPPPEYAQGLALVEAEEYREARHAFERALRKAPRDPDVLNMLAYSERRSGQLDRAIHTYQKALARRPHFPQAREYLAEAYLQAVLRELEILERYGDEAKDERRHVIEALEAAAARQAWAREEPSEQTSPKASW